MTAPFKLEPKVTHLYAAAYQHSYPHLAQHSLSFPYIHTDRHQHKRERARISSFFFL